MIKSSPIELCAASDIPEGGSTRVVLDGMRLAIFRVAGEFFVTDDDCTHGPGSLSEGVLDGYVIECDFHQGCFDVRDGRVVAPPCFVPVRTYQTIVRDDVVCLADPSLEAEEASRAHR